MNEQRNLITAVILSALILIGWSFVSEKFFPTANPPSTKVVDGKQVPVPEPKANPAAQTAAAVRNRDIVLRETPRVPIDTPRLQGSINLMGARIDDLVLTTHREGIAHDSTAIRMLSPSGAPDAYFASFGWTGEGVALPGADTVWTASGDRLAPGSPVTLSWTNGQGQRFEIQLSVDDGYMFDVRQVVANGGANAMAVKPYSLVSRIGVSKDKDSWTIHTGPTGVFNGKANYDVDFKTLTEEGDQRFSTSGGWLGFGDKYWLTALIPPQNAAVEAAFRAGANNSYQADTSPAPAIVAPGKAISYESRLFAGAKEVALLDRYEKNLGIRQFDKAIDWGWFYWFERPIYSLLHWLFQMIGNFGLAIMGLTLIVRLLMFPI
ncbi:MAG TPA: membrane protein insertase YidC, partial [Allosphingosinicella sp.]